MHSNITEAEANDFTRLFTVAPHIHTIFFNGKKSAELFRRLVLRELNREQTLITLPSTSPANASISSAKKRESWRQILTALER